MLMLLKNMRKIRKLSVFHVGKTVIRIGRVGGMARCLFLGMVSVLGKNTEKIYNRAINVGDKSSMNP